MNDNLSSIKKLKAQMLETKIQLKQVSQEVKSNYQNSDELLDQYGEKLNKSESAFSNEDPEYLKLAMSKLQLEYVERKWNTSDKLVVYFAATVGTLCDILINQTNALKPIDNLLKESLSGSTLQQSLENVSKKMSGGSAPIDFQDFEMHGLKNIHEAYSFGHDPVRFLQGVHQMMTGTYMGVDRFGNLIKAPFGTAQSNIVLALFSWIAHITADFCNKLSIPYPGSTFLVQYGNDELRSKMVSAYRAGWNGRQFLYQGFVSLMVQLIIYGNEVLENYHRSGKLDFKVHNRTKYLQKLVVAQGLVVSQNLLINGVRAYSGDSSAITRVNFSAIAFVVKNAIELEIHNHKEANKIDAKTKDYMKLVKDSKEF